MQKIIPFSSLQESDLIVDAIYEGDKKGNSADDPMNKILKCGNQGGFRYVGSYEKLNFPYIILYSNFDDYDWPDNIDFQTGILTYYGDNKKPGHLLNDTQKKGNAILELTFNFLHTGNHKSIKPFFVFGKGFKGRDVIFRGLAVPGGLGITSLDDLQAIWKFKDNQRFQNYKSLFTILDVPVISRKWINDLNNGVLVTKNTPKAFIDFYNKGVYRPLISERSLPIRKRHEQTPTTKEDIAILKFIYDYFSAQPTNFELFAADISKMLLKDVVEIDVTRPWRDGGRDALGKLRIGTKDSFILADFAVEAKCYNTNNSVGVREVSRLISRIKNREFGIVVTTSYIHSQAYEEVVKDKHPILFVSGKDIVDILKENGLSNTNLIKEWIEKLFSQ